MSDIEQFNDWLDYMPDFLEEFQSLMKEANYKFDYSPESLDVLEACLLSNYASTEELLGESESQTLNLFACYIGESLLRIQGGKWELQQDPEDVYYGLPVILQPDGDVECPITIATAAADRRTGDFIRSCVCGDE